MADQDKKDENPPPNGDDGSKPDKPKDDGQRGQSDDDKKGEDDKPKEKKGLLQRPILLGSMILVLLVAALGGLLWWLNARNFESTDDAFVDAHIVRLAPQTSGRVTAVYVEDNALVEAGHPIIDIDSSDVRTRVAQAEAQKSQAQAGVDNARAQIVVNEANYRQSLSDLAAAEGRGDQGGAGPDAISRSPGDQPPPRWRPSNWTKPRLQRGKPRRSSTPRGN